MIVQCVGSLVSEVLVLCILNIVQCPLCVCVLLSVFCLSSSVLLVSVFCQFFVTSSGPWFYCIPLNICKIYVPFPYPLNCPQFGPPTSSSCPGTRSAGLLDTAQCLRTAFSSAASLGKPSLRSLARLQPSVPSSASHVRRRLNRRTSHSKARLGSPRVGELHPAGIPPWSVTGTEVRGTFASSCAEGDMQSCTPCPC